MKDVIFLLFFIIMTILVSCHDKEVNRYHYKDAVIIDSFAYVYGRLSGDTLFYSDHYYTILTSKNFRSIAKIIDGEEWEKFILDSVKYNVGDTLRLRIDTMNNSVEVVDPK